MSDSYKVPKPNHNFVPEYQMSSIPYVTSSAANEVANGAGQSISFPNVSRWISVSCLAGSTKPLRVGFTENGVESTVTANYLIVNAASNTPRLEVKCKELWFAGDGGTSGFSLIAGLTNIPSNTFPTLTGSLQDAKNNDLLPGVG